MNSAVVDAPTVLAFLGPAGDHNGHPLTAVPELLAAVATATHRGTRTFGHAFRVWDQSSDQHVEDARASLTSYADAVEYQLRTGRRLVCVHGRCATSIATIPRVMQVYPDCVVVWLDAHADLNIPGRSTTDYLGGMAISGPLGWWNSGFGGGLTPDRLVLVGARSIDEAETEVIDRYAISVLPPERAAPAAILERVAGRPVYVHLDCDVLEPGICRTDYREPGGLTLLQLTEIATSLSEESHVVGVEIAEWEGPGSASADELLQALGPLL